eukprot:2009887-Alexandrium_andersonii.AAC.1
MTRNCQQWRAVAAVAGGGRRWPAVADGSRRWQAVARAERSCQHAFVLGRVQAYMLRPCARVH